MNRLGLHARAAARLVRLAGGFSSSIMLFRPDTNAQANAKSILSVLALSAGQGTVINIEIDGNDESDAMNEITNLFESGFGEQS
ncbi:MAG: HPr family phosphocarrier protein [Pyrinomonadaceae bacterium]